MIDDLVTKGTLEPYRLLTSRAEFRLLLRHDNADQRLMKKAYEIGLVSEERYQKLQVRNQEVEGLKEHLQQIRFTMKDSVNQYLNSLDYGTLNEGISAYDLLKRPHVSIEGLKPYLSIDFVKEVGRQVEIEIKYEGYITKAKKEAERLMAMEKLLLPEDIDYEDVIQLSLEGRQKLIKYKPRTIGQASRISGVNPADISVLAIYLEQRRRMKKSETLNS